MIRITAQIPRGFEGPQLIKNQQKGPSTVVLTFNEIHPDLAVGVGTLIRNWGYTVEVADERTVVEVLS